MQFAGTPTVYIFTSHSPSSHFLSVRFPLFHSFTQFVISTLEAALCLFAPCGQKRRNDAFHRYLIYMLIPSPSGAFCRCCYCCFLCGFISAVGCYFCRINTFKLPKLTSRFLMVELTLSQDTCRRLRSTCKSFHPMQTAADSVLCHSHSEIFPPLRNFMPRCKRASKPTTMAKCMAHIDKILWEQ